MPLTNNYGDKAWGFLPITLDINTALWTVPAGGIFHLQQFFGTNEDVAIDGTGTNHRATLFYVPPGAAQFIPITAMWVLLRPGRQVRSKLVRGELSHLSGGRYYGIADAANKVSFLLNGNFYGPQL